MMSLKFEVVLAQIDWQPLWEEHGIPLAVMGLVVVFAALILLRVFIGLLPRIMALLNQWLPEEAEINHQAAPLVVAGPAEGDLSEELLVVIAAAVAATVVKPHRIVRTRVLTAEDMSWSLEGRRQHHASHRINPRDPR